MAVEFHPLTVDVAPETDESVALSFDIPSELADQFRALPGQHLVLRAEIAGQEVRRSYSICSPAGKQLKVGVKRIPDGVFSTWATQELQTGDTVEVMAPIGEFVHHVDPTANAHYVAIAAGSGITPILSIISTILDQEPLSQVTLIYGNKSSRSIMFLDDVEALKDRYHQRFQLLHVLSRESNTTPLFEGRIDADKIRLLTTQLLAPDTIDQWFLCGPLEMVETVSSTLEQVGVDPSAIKTELFFDERIEPVPEAVNDAAATLTFTLNGRTSEVGINPDGPVLLDYARQARAEVPFACKGGMCATCKARVVEGKVTMEKNYALNEDEIAAGFVLTCQARSEGNVTLTYDVHGGVGR